MGKWPIFAIFEKNHDFQISKTAPFLLAPFEAKPLKSQQPFLLRKLKFFYLSNIFKIKQNKAILNEAQKRTEHAVLIGGSRTITNTIICAKIKVLQNLSLD